MSNEINQDAAALSRRGLFKKLIYGGTAVGAAAGVAKVADSALTEAEADAQKAYAKDVTPGDRVIAEREHVLMSGEEKESMVDMFVENYEKSRPEP